MVMVGGEEVMKGEVGREDPGERVGDDIRGSVPGLVVMTDRED